MKVFISWSGERSREAAKVLREWLPLVLNEIKPWMSDQDIGAGASWSGEITKELNNADFGIVCVTPENQSREWLNFEAGAISSSVGSDTKNVAPFLVGFSSKSDLSGPLSRFQAIEPNRDDMLNLLGTINRALDDPRTPASLEKLLDALWSILSSELLRGMVVPGSNAATFA